MRNFESSPIAPAPDRAPPVPARAAREAQAPSHAPGVSAAEQALATPGHALPAGERGWMEQRFGHDFSRVRVHADSRAAGAAASLGARAFTLGDDVVFGRGEYAPGTVLGRALLAHELAHVVQQQHAPAAVQGKLQVGGASTPAEREADAAVHAVMGGAPGSAALQLRQRLRAAASPATIQRADNTWGGELKADRYKLVTDPDVDGVDIALRFIPNKHVNAEKIGMVQTVRSMEKGAPVFIGSGKAQQTLKDRSIPPGEAGEGTRIDRLSSHGNPLYAADAPGAKDRLQDTPTVADWGQHGWRYTDAAGTLQTQDATLLDTPTLVSTRKESSQTFETTALAVAGVQEGTFYGSVQWGWSKDAAGKVSPLPLKVISTDVPTATFARASETWNASKTSTDAESIDLPFAWGRYINTQRTWLVSDPRTYKKSILGKLEKDTRLEVTNKGEGKSFNKTDPLYQWWKVTVVDGTHIGKVGWVMQTLLSEAKSK
ncbi:MAG TPA: DUF4157 domain-containing protein [Longimicrobium sp.]